MRPQDIVPVLEKLGFVGLSLTKTEGLTSAFKFQDWNLKTMRATFGTPSVTANGKVVVFSVPNLGRVGVAPSTNMVRVIVDESVAPAPAAKTTHLAGTVVPAPYLLALEKAKVNPSLRVAWMKKMWAWFNEHKFGNRMEMPKLTAENQTGRFKNSRGLYTHGFSYAWHDQPRSLPVQRPPCFYPRGLSP